MFSFSPTSNPPSTPHLYQTTRPILHWWNQLETSKWDSIFSGSEVEPETHFYIFLCVYTYACMSWCICVGQKTPCGCQFFLIPHGAWGSNLGCQVRAWCWSRGQQQDRGCVLVLWFSHCCQCFIFLILIVCKLIIQRNNWVLYKVLWPQNAAQWGNTPVNAPIDINTPPIKPWNIFIDKKVSLALITSVVLALWSTAFPFSRDLRGVCHSGHLVGTLGTLLQPSPPELTVWGKLV